MFESFARASLSFPCIAAFFLAVLLHIIESKRNEDGNERERERDKTIDVVTEYNHFTWGCNHLATFPPSSFETERENLNSEVL